MRQLERGEQIAVINWAAMMERQFPELQLLFAVPNGGSRHKAEARYLKAAGVRAGIPDLCLPVSRQGYHALYIEMKSAKGKMSPAQSAVMQKLHKYGNYVATCYSAENAIEVLKWYLTGKGVK